MLQQAPAKVKCLGRKDQVSVLYFRYFMRCSAWTLSVGFSLRSESCLAFVFDVLTLDPGVILWIERFCMDQLC